MNIGTVAWGWTPTPEDLPVGDALERIADRAKSLGFTHIDYLSDYASLDAYFDDAACRRIAAHCKGIGLPIGGLVFQSALWNSPDPAISEKQLAYFEKCCKAANALTATFISCIMPTPYGAKPTSRPSPSDKVNSNLPADYSWAEDWGRFTSNLKKAARIAARYSLRIAMECFPRTLCSTPHAMLALLDAVNEPNIGIQVDTAHLMNQNLDIEAAIHMLGGDRIFNVHLKDSDGLTRGNLAPGAGLIDYVAVLRALKNVGYKGSASIEVEFTLDPERYMKDGLEHIKACLLRV